MLDNALLNKSYDACYGASHTHTVAPTNSVSHQSVAVTPLVIPVPYLGRIAGMSNRKGPQQVRRDMFPTR